MPVLFRLVKYISRKTVYAIILVIIAAIFDSAATLASPYIVKEIINRGFYGNDPSALYLWVPIFVGVGLLSAVFRFSQRFVNEYASQTIIYNLRNQLYSRIQKQSIDFFDRMETGQLISLGTRDIDAIRRLLSIGLRIFFRAVCLFAGIFILVGIMDWQLMLIVMGFSPLLFIVMFTYARRARPLMRKIQNKFGDMNSVISENVHGSRVVRAFAAEEFEEQKFEKENKNYLELNLEMAKLRGYITTLFPFILSIGTFSLIFFGGRSVVAGTLDVGSLIAINSYLIMLARPTRFLAFSILHYQQGTASLDRIFEIIDMEKKVVEKEDAITMPPIEGNISFRNVTFSYTEDHPPVLKDINLDVPAGETVAFLGTTGSGKSTIVSLVPRFYDPQEGKVLIDEINIKDVKLDSLRRQIALVQQEAFLFARTIKENISFGKPDAKEEEIIRAAKIAQAHEFITSFPDGYDTVIGERGVNLSGGQKQRLTIARAVLLNSPLLIMDDSSSALDFETESQFQKAVSVLIKGKTTLIVTQRLSTIKYATMIIVMDQGRIVEQGTHKELMREGGLYKHLYETQLIDQELKLTEEATKLTKDHQETAEVKSTSSGGTK